MKENFQISPSLAQMIVDAAKEVIGKDINLIHLDGKVVASTDPDRVGSFHAAALQVQKKGSVVEVTANEAFKGARKGINYPVMIDQIMLGVIGISGDPEECKSLGFLLTKITEVLIKEQMIKSVIHSLDELRSSIVRMLIFENEKENTFMNEHLQQLQYELEERAFVAIIHLPGLNNASSLPVKMNGILLEQGIKLFTYLFPNQYALIINASQYKSILQIFNSYFRSMNVSYSIGIGSIGYLEELAKSYTHAKLALKYALSKKVTVCEYAKLDLEMIMENIDFHIRKDYAAKLIGELSEAEINLLHTYYNNNLSLKKTAEELFIHKNTLQYRLDKIAQKTAANPRDYHDSVKIYLALLLQTL
ncbi:sugar diacid recognition domain-containing protein [Peribacillus sp. ACCC06369]|uniref:CdaR family transcriptional regulator n=1 Tax=Peribacillus sp. ACCC06369 TaxID=3055860 RepID=UPI00259FFA78|nr:sugar diacid recognition domain-containing protein [Peribacillus sp. ACCC06369]MDM5357731.1 sugar diacid recognition domain-containing protein [Peribacillus sp. ACCC06369]